MPPSIRRVWLAVQQHKTRQAAAKALGISLRTLYRTLARDPYPATLQEEVNRAKAHAMHRLRGPHPPTTIVVLRWAMRRHWSDPAIAAALEQLADEGRIRLGGGRNGSVVAVTPTR